MNDFFLSWDNTPTELLRRARAELEPFFDSEAPACIAARALGALQGGHAAAVARRLVLVAAAVHAAARFPAPPPAITEERPRAALSAAAWLLLAARERAGSRLPNVVEVAFDGAIEALGGAIIGEEAPEGSAEAYGLEMVLPALCGHEASPVCEGAGLALGKLLRLASEVHALSRPRLAGPRPRLLARLAEGAGQAGPFALALALAQSPLPDRLPLLRTLGHPATATRVRGHAEALAADVPRGATGQAAEALAALAGALLGSISRGLSSARFISLMPNAARPDEELTRAIRLTRDALVADTALREAWEIQRWGGFCEEPRLARLFPVGVCLLALDAAGVDVSARMIPLLGRREPDGYRYYEGYTGIAPDSDLLGLALQMAVRCPERDRLVAELSWPIEVLVRNVGEDGCLPVWLEQHLREPLPEGSPRWEGHVCVAVAVNACLGLVEAEIPLPEGFFDRVLAWITRTWDAEGMRAVYFYGAPYTRLLFARLARVVDRVPGDPAPRRQLHAIVTRIEAEISSSVADDGGWGSPLATACHLEVLATSPRRTNFDPFPAVTYLASRQGYDGYWPWEPFFCCPGKDGAPAAFGARAVTSAVCLGALVRTHARATRGS
ncbi:hypothetical protein [Polyangium sp. y55x31]|uniref:hypothetical protein n=1 Tax=Polyangium sp. y55x31 TaxID=3042688 RepID=UPI0024823085|nr:hypothetical protein [Polyangium sp. y55x31]MDI1483922.1 hypothetical protein [Polyangium sp. y55x31]